MNPRSIIKTPHRAASFTAALLLLSAIGLTVSGVMAEQPKKKQVKPSEATTLATPTPTAIPYCDWPPAEPDKTRVKIAFQKALDQSIVDSTFRNRLLDCSPAKCDQPKLAVKEKLDEDNPNKIDFPTKHIVIFYERDDGLKNEKSTKMWNSKYPPNHCFSILHLPPYTGQNAAKASVFKNHLRCCYDPW